LPVQIYIDRNEPRQAAVIPTTIPNLQPPSSSPIGSDIAPDVLLQEYIDWHKQRDLSRAEKYDIVGQRLMEEDLKFENLHPISGLSIQELRDLSISMGIALALRNDYHRFKRHRHGPQIDISDNEK